MSEITGMHFPLISPFLMVKTPLTPAKFHSYQKNIEKIMKLH
jgi:hypothetical protein